MTKPPDRPFLPVHYLTFSHFNRAGIPHAVTTRLNGVSPEPFHSLNLSFACRDSVQNVQKNREITAQKFGINAEKLTFVRQVHGSDCLLLDKSCPTNTESIPADGLASRNSDRMIGVLVADCYPVLLGTCDGSVVAAVHAGRRSIEQGIIFRMLALLFFKWNVPPHQLLAGIGPGVSRENYPVDIETAERFISVTQSSAIHSRPVRGIIHLDLRQTIEMQLIQSGIPQTHIEHCMLCTAGNPNLLFSYRHSDGITGRFAALIRSPQTRLL